MKTLHPLLLALAVTAFAAPTGAAQNDPHAGHHPATTAPATPAAAPAPVAASPVTNAAPSPDMARMDAQMKAMRTMHDKMMAAKTSAERNALMAEHMKVMQDGMNMMNEMSSRAMGDMNMMGEMPQGKMEGMKPNMTARHQMMEKRMEMMQAMMQMMMDRMSATPMK